MRRCTWLSYGSRLERRGDSLVVAIGGELDIVTSRQLDEHLTRGPPGATAR